MEEKKRYDLEERTLAFLKRVISFLRAAKKITLMLRWANNLFDLPDP
ncbi:MAG: hypothetical protein Q8S39_16090 [Ignavibacteria bacterium]|nr:hypothetical protein [Ignavibacteria bacterium]